MYTAIENYYNILLGRGAGGGKILQLSYGLRRNNGTNAYIDRIL